MLVDIHNFYTIIQKLKLETTLAVDTETTGLNAYKGNRLFSVIISTADEDYYFHFNPRLDHLCNFAPKDNRLNIYHLETITKLFLNEDLTIYMHNAKFDMHFLANEGAVFNCTVVCTEAMSRLVNNQLPSYSLANLGALIGHEKDNTVEKYISKHKLYTLVDVGKKKPRKDKHFDLVPFDIMSKYGMQDGRVCYELGEYCLKRLKDMKFEQEFLGLPVVSTVVLNEIKLTKTLFKMERKGIRIDVDYCKEAFQYEKSQYLEAMMEYEALTSIPFEDAASCFKKAFKKLGLTAGKTDKGKDSYSEDNLPDNDVTRIILKYRKHYKRAHTYFKNYIDMADDNGILHCNFRQAGTVTGRMSSSNPNLQNVPKHGEDESKYPLRACFIPRDGYFFAMIDYDQMEYRLLMDVINEEEVIRMILEEGLDVHTATANLANVKRLIAKNINFLAIYGGGPSRLQDYTKGTLAEAKKMLLDYFRSIKKVKPFMKAITNTAATRGYVVNTMGRRLLYHRDRPYIMTNHFIQGGCGDICKKAMNDIDTRLADESSYMLLQVHDELIIEVKYEEEAILEELKILMQNAYVHKHLPLTAGIDYSKTNWHDKKEYK